MRQKERRYSPKTIGVMVLGFVGAFFIDRYQEYGNFQRMRVESQQCAIEKMRVGILAERYTNECAQEDLDRAHLERIVLDRNFIDRKIGIVVPQVWSCDGHQSYLSLPNTSYTTTLSIGSAEALVFCEDAPQSFSEFLRDESSGGWLPRNH